MKILTAILGVCFIATLGCSKKINLDKPVVFKYRDKDIVVNLVLNNFDKRSHFGFVRICNVSSKKLKFMPRAISLNDKKSTYLMGIDSIASVGFSLLPNEIVEQKIFFDISEGNIDFTKIEIDVNFKRLAIDR